MASNNMSGIEKLKELAYQIEREHVSELQTIEKRYKVDLREAREARDIAIKEASEYKHQLGDIIKYLGSCSRKKPVLSCQGRYERIMSELYKRLMPQGMEWPRFEDGMKITCDDAPEDIAAVCLALDGSCYALHYDMPDDERMCLYEVSERVKRPVTDVLGADGLPIEVGDTVHLTDGSGIFEVQAVRDGAAQDEFGEWYDAGLLTHAAEFAKAYCNTFVSSTAAGDAITGVMAKMQSVGNDAAEPEVLGADGEPIKFGDTVYMVSGSEPYRVERLPKRKDGMLAVYGLESKREKLYCYYPDNLTHTQPNTQERIDEDAKLDPCEYVRIVVEIITTRLILLAKIMRAWTVTIADLMRHQRELDKRTMGGE